MQYKQCTKCQQFKSVVLFHKSSRGHASQCSNCKAIYDKKRRSGSKLIEIYNQNKDYRRTNSRKIIDQKINRYATDIQYKLSCSLRRRLLRSIKGNFKSGSAVRDLGCSIEEYKIYLESKFYSCISWNNYGKMWQIDHIIPLSKFNLSNRSQFLKACHYTNTQPLSIADHILKTFSK